MSAGVAASHDPTRPVLIVHGDRQGEILLQCLRSAPDIAERYELARLPHGSGWAAVAAPLWRRCAIFWRQIGATGGGEVERDGAEPPGLDPRCLVVTYPILRFAPQWPHQLPDIAAADTAGFGYSDRILMQLAKTDLAGPTLFARYLQLDAAAAAAVEPALDAWFDDMAALDRRANVRLAGFIAAQFRAMRLFRAVDHPTRDLMRELLRRLVAATWPEEVRPGGGLEALHATCPWLGLPRQSADPLRRRDDPVSPGVAAALDLVWWSPDDVYLNSDDAGGRRAELIEDFVIAHVEAQRRRQRPLPVASVTVAAQPALAAPENGVAARRLLSDSHALLAKGDSEGAIAAAESACAAAPRDVACAVHLAYLLIGRRPPEQAERACRRALTLAPEDSGANNAFSQLCARMNRLPEAIAAARKASHAAPANMHAAAHLGNLLRKSGDMPGAENAYRLALAAAPDSAVVHISLAELYAERGMVHDAIATARRAVALAPQDARATALLARVSAGSDHAP